MAPPTLDNENAHDSQAVDMGYQPVTRRGSMSPEEEKERRASIKAILADDDLSPRAKRHSIQHLMDGRRNSLSDDNKSTSATASSMGDLVHQDMGYGDHHNFCIEIQPYSDEQTKSNEQNRPRCTHYDRKCTMIAPCCGAAFGCRLCHDSSPVLPTRLEARRSYQRSASLPSSFTSMMSHTPAIDTHHTIDRFAVREIICRECFTRQSSKTNNCVNCGIQFGAYHCSICNLWMSDAEGPYHCADCGFCRVGGAQNFSHCPHCDMCIDITLIQDHDCRAGKYQANCPVCQEYMFSSRQASHEMPCGHAIHWDCFQQLAAHDSRCPICKKTAETRERMLPTWQALASTLAMQPVPPDIARVVNITCIDCETSSHAQPWHYMGIQCLHCQSFNTVVDQIVLTGPEAHEFLEMNAIRQAIHGNEKSTRRRRVNRRRSAI